MLVVAAGLLLTAWIIGWGVLEIPGRWIHVLPVLAVVPMVVHVMRTEAEALERAHVAVSTKTRRHVITIARK